MAKNALLGVLNNTIGRYVANLDAETLNVGIWSGQVELHDLELDVEACNAELAAAVPPVPLRVVDGKFASLKIEIPWRSLSSQSVVMKASGLHVRVAPSANNTTDDTTTIADESAASGAKEEEQAAEAARRRGESLLLANTTREQTNELMKLTGDDGEGGASGNNSEANAGFAARLVKRIIENLQVDIGDVSIVMLDNDGTEADSGTGSGSSVGVALENLSFVTTDMAGQRSFVDRSNATQSSPSDLLNKFLYKKLSISGFGIFVDTSKITVSGDDFHDANEEEEDEDEDNVANKKHSYILEPLNLEAKFREADASITHDYPKWLLKSNLPALKMALTQAQYQETMQLSQTLTTTMAPYANARPLLFPQYRPLRRPTSDGNAKEWWQYAFKSVCRLTGRRSWMTFYEAFQKRKAYIPLYKRKIYAEKPPDPKHDPKADKKPCPWLEPLTITEMAEVDRIESDRTIAVEGIMMWRNIADSLVEKEREKWEKEHPDLSSTTGKKKGMLSRLFGSSSSSDSDNSAYTPIEMSTDELRALEDVGMDELSFAKELSDTAKLCEVEFQLGALSVNLENAALDPMLGLEMGKVSAKFESDAGGAFTFRYKLASLDILDHGAQRSNSLFPSVLRSLQIENGKSEEEEEKSAVEDVFQIHMAKNAKGDSKLTVKLIPFEAVVSPHLLSEVMEFSKVAPAKTSGSRSNLEIVEINEDEDNNDDGDDDELKPTNDQDGKREELKENFSNALVEAWEEKTKDKTTLTIDLDLQAPILVLPENCSDPNASVVVLNLGGFRFKYGAAVDSHPRVQQWLDDNPRDANSFNLSNRSGDSQSSLNGGIVVDYGRLELENMTFMVDQAETWRKVTSVRANKSAADHDAIIEPITVRFDFAVESATSSSVPRVCVFAAMPTCKFQFSPQDLSKTLQVYSAWMQSLEEQGMSSGDNGTDNQNERIANRKTESQDNGSAIQIDEVNQSIETSLSQDTTLFTTMYVDIAVEKYSVVVYDSGEFQKSADFDAKNSESGSTMPLANVAEGLVMEGGTHLVFEMATNAKGTTTSIETEIQGKDFQIYSAFGKDLRRPLQILEPVTGKVELVLRSQGDEMSRKEVKVNVIDDIDVTCSMKNLALVNAISEAVSSRLAEGLKKSGDDNIDESLQLLDEEKEKQLEAIELSLQGDSQVAITQVNSRDKSAEAKTAANGASSSVTIINVRVPITKLLIINDLQGLDEALFRVEVKEFVTKSMVAVLQDPKKSAFAQTVFNIQVHSKMLADYYDPPMNRWNKLLKEPWELAFKSERAPDKTSKTNRYGTRADINFMPLHVVFSEHFLIGLGSANKMLAMSADDEAKSHEMDTSTDEEKINCQQTRHLVAALPYALENFSGLDVEYRPAELPSNLPNRTCHNSSKEFFRFNPPKGEGKGGKRQYGEDALFNASIKLYIGDNVIEIKHLDDQLGRPKRCHLLNDSTLVVTSVVREGKSTVLRLASNFSMQNRTPIPMHTSIIHGSKEYPVGECPASSALVNSSQPRLSPYDVKQGTLSRCSCRLGLRFDAAAEVGKVWAENKRAKLVIRFSPKLQGDPAMAGELELEMDHPTIANATNRTVRLRKLVTCKGTDEEEFVFISAMKFQLIGDIKLVVNITLEPRAQFVNTLPVAISVLTKTRQVLSSGTLGTTSRKDTVHHLEYGSKMEVYSAGDNLSVKVRCSEQPSKGTPTTITRQWIDIPLSSGMDTPVLCLFPFDGEQALADSKAPGSEFYIAEANSRLSNFFLERLNDEGEHQDALKSARKPGPRTYLFTVGNYGVDHTNNVLFEQMVSRSKHSILSSSKKVVVPFSTFIEQECQRSISLLPTAEVPIRLIEPGSQKERKSALFRVEEVSMSEGGAQATPILWDDGTDSGYFVYRRLVSSFQSELHVIPEFLIFNGDDKLTVTVKQNGGPDVEIAPKQTTPVFSVNRKKGLKLAFQYGRVDGSTKRLHLEELGLHIEIVHTSQGVSLGSVAVQTSIGGTDSRLVIKLGKVGSIEREKPKNPMDMLPQTFASDNLRLRLQAESFSLTLNQGVTVDADADGQGTLEVANSKEKEQLAEASFRKSSLGQKETPICTIVTTNVVYDVQKIFKESEDVSNAGEHPERCQLSLMIQDFQILDEMPDSPLPIVFQYSGENRFIDFCVRTKGPLYSNNVKVDLVDLLLGHSGKQEKNKNEKMILQTNEDFVWKLIDTADLISKASAESANPTNQGDTDQALATYVAAWHVVPNAEYMAPQVSTIYDIAKANVSPFNILLSFTRTPQAERYEKFINNQGAHLMRYFTQQLKFTIKNCNLRFAHYEEKALKGPLDRLIEILTAVYVGRMKLKAVSILAASSFSDWKSLAARDGGDDEFVDGDILRVTGALAGNSVAYAFNKVGRGMGKGITAGFETIGGGIENGAALVGARSAGSSINSAIAGVGGGIGGTLQGVGEGTGNLFKGAGKGAGHFFGGLTGGGSAMVKGLGKGIVTCDASAVASGFKTGAKHVGNGVRQSTKAVGGGVGGGVGSVFKGSVKGVKSSVAKRATTKASGKAPADDLASLREEFKDQDYS